MPILATLVLSVALVALAGGRPSADVHVKPWRLIALSAALLGQNVFVVLAARLDSSVASSLWALFAVLAAALAISTPGVPGRWLIGLGMSLNAIVVLANLGMPVATSTALPDQFYRAVDARAGLVLLADVQPSPGGYVLSLGDLLMLVGVVVAVTSMALRRSPDENLE